MKSPAYKAFRAACKALDIENRSLHSTWHTMITWARRGGARPDVLEKIAHSAAGQIIDQYTHWDLEPLPGHPLPGLRRHGRRAPPARRAASH